MFPSGMQNGVDSRDRYNIKSCYVRRNNINRDPSHGKGSAYLSAPSNYKLNKQTCNVHVSYRRNVHSESSLFFSTSIPSFRSFE